MNPCIIKDFIFKHYGNHKYSKGVQEAIMDPIPLWSLTVIISGGFRYSVGDQMFDGHKGDAFLTPPNSQRKYYYNGEPFHYLHFNFNESDDHILPRETVLHGVISPEVLSLLKTYATRQDVVRYYANEKLVNLLNYIIFDMLAIRSIGTSNNYVINAIKYIDANISRQLTLTEIAKAVHISKDYLSHLFKTELGRSMIDYTNEHKMNIAKSQILWSDAALHDIAASLGYDNYSYFSRIFKRYIGKAPTSLTRG